MIRIYADNLESAYHQVNQLFTSESGVTTHNTFRGEHYMNAFDLFIEAAEPGNLMYLEELGYTNRKINHLLRTYLIPEEFWNWIAQIKDVTEKHERVDSDIMLRTSDNSKHSNGPCLISMSYRSHKKPVLTVTSRSAELPQIFGADTLLIAAIGRILVEELGIGELKVQWFISSIRIRSRAANFYRLQVYPYPVTYTHPAFQAHVQRQWDRILSDQDKKVTFSKLVKLQEEFKRVVIDKKNPETLSGVEEFEATIKKGWNT